MIPAAFDSLLFAHVAEHLSGADCVELLRDYLDYLKPGGRVVVITPQEAGYRSDATHVEFVDFRRAAQLLNSLDLSVERQYSFPFPTWVGKLFRHNEFVTIGRKET